MEEIISLSLFLSNFQLLIDKLRILSKIKRHNRKISFGKFVLTNHPKLIDI